MKAKFTYKRAADGDFVVKKDGKAVGWVREGQGQWIVKVYGAHMFTTPGGGNFAMQAALRACVQTHKSIFGGA